MHAVVYDEFRGPIAVREVPDPEPGAGEVVLRVMATGVCRSDWHGWQGHDADITDLPHVPGHEMAGVIDSVGSDVEGWAPGDRVTVPFVAGCGVCQSCLAGNPQVCPNQSQPGFTHWGSFAELVRIPFAQNNLVLLPDEIDFTTAAALGCRFATAHRAVVAQGKVAAGEWVVIHGCGGVGLSAVMIASSLGARVVAVDVNQDALDLAKHLGAEAVVKVDDDVAATIRDITDGGAHVSVDAIGNPTVVRNSLASLRRQGRHVQVGLMVGDQARTPIQMDRVIAHELEIIGSHGAQASVLAALVEAITRGDLDPGRLVTKTLTLEQGAKHLAGMNESVQPGIAVIDRF
jgi:alcohol dehydrogenase